MVRSMAPAATAGTAATATSSGGWTRIFVGAGTRDRVGPGDLVGAITGEAGVTRESIGKIDLRENHSLVEIASADAERVAGALTGTMLRGRRVIARLDKGREARGDRGPRGPRSSRSDRGERGPRDRGERPDRGPRRVRGDVERHRPPTTEGE
jgi:hypothetical protein